MEEPIVEDFGTKNCNRCKKLFKRTGRFNFFCAKCAKKNSNESERIREHRPTRVGFNLSES